MKTLATLSKIAQHELNQKRRTMVQLEERQQQLIEEATALEAVFKQEKAFAGQSMEAGYTFLEYSQTIKYKRRELLRAMDTIAQKMDSVAEEIYQLFGELKKYDIMHDVKMQEMQDEEKRTEQLELDEIGIVGHMRKEGGA